MESIVTEVRALTESAFVLQFQRNGVVFEPGHHLHVGIPGSVDVREYSVFSGINDNYLEILVKEVDDGVVSAQLHGLRPGDGVQVHGPYGFFLLTNDYQKRKHYLVATGTGIAPFRCYARSAADFEYQVIHGVRSPEEQYARDAFPAHRYTSCVSGGKTGDGDVFAGRVTDFLRGRDIDPDGLYYLCGNCDMIYEVYDILKSAGIGTKNIFAEVYF